MIQSNNGYTWTNRSIESVTLKKLISLIIRKGDQLKNLWLIVDNFL